MSETDRAKKSAPRPARRRGRRQKSQFRGLPKNCRVYLVGGAVRERLLQRPVGERDWVVVGSTPEEMAAAGFIPVAKDFPVFIHPGDGEEYALARTERKTGRGHRGFSFHAAKDVTLEEDLARRDLTINAMAMDKREHLIDPHNGRRDLEARKLRHVSPAFSEDPLRVLRVARFAARYDDLGFDVAEETMALMRQIAASGELRTLTPERVWKELSKALDETRPSVFFHVLRRSQALATTLPEMQALGDETLEQIMRALDTAARMGLQRLARFAVLGCFFARTEALEAFCDRLRAPRGARQQALHVHRWHEDCRDALNLPPENVHDMLLRLDAWRRPQQLDCFLLSCLACLRSPSGHRNDNYPQISYLRRAAEICAQQTLRTLRADAAIDARLGPKPDGAQIAEQLRLHRVELIARLRAAFASIAEAAENVE